MKKLLFALLIVFSLSFVSVKLSAATTPTKLYIHYQRVNNDYTGFNSWIWEAAPSSKDGKEYAFDKTDAFGAYLVIDLTKELTTATKIGIIIKANSGWVDGGYREPGGDRFIDFTTAPINEAGEIHAYFVEGATGIGLDPKDIMEASFKVNGDITISVLHNVGTYALYENDAEIKTGTITDYKFTINMSSYDLSKGYKIVVTFEGDVIKEKNISVANLYDTDAFVKAYTYDGELGAIYTKTQTTFRLWAPISEKVELLLYDDGHPNYNKDGKYNATPSTPYKTVVMTKGEKGTWETIVLGDLGSKYYTYKVTNYGNAEEVVDPYAYSTGANGLRGMVVDFESTNPMNWEYNSRPNTISSMADYIIYELHVRDLTTHKNWGGNSYHRGKFLGLTEYGTSYSAGGKTVTTGFSHIVELGVNAVQILPFFDYGYVDETKSADQFNWGYMPINYNTLDGYYSSNPYDGNVRINEFKQMMMGFHQEDIRVIMDVVYNHNEGSGGNLQRIVPGYYHRMVNGAFSNGSGTGNETASERKMMQKYMVDSVLFWAKEYNISGFRFDLMGLHDLETMQLITNELRKVDETIAVYGEPWTGGTTPLPESDRAIQDNISNLTNVGAFNDISRDGIKGSVFTKNEGGWIQGNNMGSNKSKVQYGIVGGINHPSVSGIESKKYMNSPLQTINYVSCHDNNTLNDKLSLTGSSGDLKKQMQIQANAITLTSQGVPFLHAGVEMMRSKVKTGGGYDENSYMSSDTVNQIKWDQKITHLDVFNQYKALIEIRKLYSGFKLENAESIKSNITFFDTPESVIAYKISGDIDIIVIHVSKANQPFILTLDQPYYRIFDKYGYANDESQLSTGSALVETNSSAILVSKIAIPETNPEDGLPTWAQVVIIVGSILVVAGAGVGVFFIIKKKKAN